MINNIIEVIDDALKVNAEKIGAMAKDRQAAMKHAEELQDRIGETQQECDRLRAAKDALAGPNLLKMGNGMVFDSSEAAYYQAGKDNV